MKTLIIALISLVTSFSASALVTPANGCVDNKCVVEALFHKNDKGETIFADRAAGQYVAALTSTEGVIVSGPDYGPSNPRTTYSA